MIPKLDDRDALILVDVQNDFLTGGALPVQECFHLVATLNRWIEAARQGGAKVVASRDWHPPDHSSFQPQGGPWPTHCVRDGLGAQFPAELRLPVDAWIVSKGTDSDRDQYSAFEATGLAQRLKDHGVRRLWIGGLALDVCVRATALDALQASFEVHLIREGTSPVDESNGQRVLEELQLAGAIIEMVQAD